MNLKQRTLLSIATLLPIFAGNVQASNASDNLWQASGHASDASSHIVQSAGHVTVGYAKIASGVIALPLVVAGGISLGVGDALWEAANTPIGEPLPITDKVLTRSHTPAEAINNNGGTDHE